MSPQTAQIYRPINAKNDLDDKQDVLYFMYKIAAIRLKTCLHKTKFVDFSQREFNTGNDEK